jgi:microcystin-dependent protein
MPTLTDVSSWLAANDSNTNCAGYDIAENCAPNGINNAMRAIMGAVARWQQAQVGIIVATGRTTAPAGWLLCSGAAVSRVAYSALFAAIGTAFGAGDGSITFNVPDLRGRAPFGADAMGGAAAGRLTTAGSGLNAVLGAAGGDQRLAQHYHTINHGTVAATTAPTGLTLATASAASAVFVETTQSAGTGGAQNVPPAAVVNFIIYAGNAG